MQPYYVNTNNQPTGEHEVHTINCPTPANPENQKQLGEFPSCEGAVSEAKKFYSSVDGCANCCPACHTR